MIMNLENAFKIEAFLVITDYSISVYEETKFENYMIWARYVTNGIKAREIGVAGNYITKVSRLANRFFGFSEDEMELFVLEFFILEKYVEYYEIIRLLKGINGYYIHKNK